MDYAYPEKRKTRRDEKAKARFNKYKRGGKHRSTEISLTASKSQE